MYGGGVAELGPSALVEVIHPTAKLQIVVSSTRIQCLDQALFRHFGVALEAQQIIALKSTVHYRADFDPISTAVLSCAAPGAFPCDLTLSDYRHLRPGVSVAG
jgi:microcystin degradation protein MlrC